MIDYKTFYDNALRHNICSDYKQKWSRAANKKQALDLALSVQGADFMCRSIKEGWGISAEMLKRDFGNYINGRYVYTDDGYSSVMYCLYDGEINVDTTLLTLIDCRCKITIPKERICEVYAVGNQKIAIDGEGICTLFCYGESNKLEVLGDKSRIHIKHI